MLIEQEFLSTYFLIIGLGLLYRNLQGITVSLELNLKF
jgi:hypothetical protein